MTRTILIKTSALFALAVCLSFALTVLGQTPNQRAGDDPFVAEYYYKAKWGYGEEFINARLVLVTKGSSA